VGMRHWANREQSRGRLIFWCLYRFVFSPTCVCLTWPASASASEGYTLPQQSIIEPEFGEPMSAFFYPIGWSKDGKFAYVATRWLVADCGAIYEIHVLDLIADKILWKYAVTKYCSQLPALGKDDSPNLALVWPEIKELVSKNVMRYNIVQSRLELNKFPLSRPGETIDADLSKTFYEHKPTMLQMLEKATLKLISRQKGEKVVYTGTFNSMLTQDVHIAGYIKNSYENRIAIILIVVPLGQHYAPGPVHYVVVGAHLEKGFR